MSSLLREFAGQIKLSYIDPPFDTGADFSQRVRIGDGSVEKLPSILEEHAYRDTWGAGHGSYLRMLYERLVLIHELLADDGRLFLHIGPNVSHYVKVVCDEIFGGDAYVNEIVWQRTLSKSLMSVRLPSNHDVILVYRKSPAATWNEDAVFKAYDPEQLDEKTAAKYTHRDPDGRLYQLSDLTNPNPDRPNLKYEFLGVTKVWRWTKERACRDSSDISTSNGESPLAMCGRTSPRSILRLGKGSDTTPRSRRHYSRGSSTSRPIQAISSRTSLWAQARLPRWRRS
jgi:adenine specific DNA methylase Mod